VHGHPFLFILVKAAKSFGTPKTMKESQFEGAHPSAAAHRFSLVSLFLRSFLFLDDIRDGDDVFKEEATGDLSTPNRLFYSAFLSNSN